MCTPTLEWWAMVNAHTTTVVVANCVRLIWLTTRFCFSLVVGRWEVENVRIEHILSRTESEMLGRSTRNENSSGSRGSTPRINRNFVQPLVCFYRLRRNIQQKYSKGMAIPCVCVWCSGLVVHIQKNAHLSFLFCIVQHRWFAVGAIFVRGNESWIWQSFRVVHCQNGKIRQALPSYKCRSNSKQRHVGGLPRTSNFLKGQPYFFCLVLLFQVPLDWLAFWFSKYFLCTYAPLPQVRHERVDKETHGKPDVRIMHYGCPSMTMVLAIATQGAWWWWWYLFVVVWRCSPLIEPWFIFVFWQVLIGGFIKRTEA